MPAPEETKTGVFYKGDSYLILKVNNQRTNNDKLLFVVVFNTLSFS